MWFIKDELGNYEYSYNNINSAKHESGNALTGVVGTYSYVDGFGAPQRVDYVADGLVTKQSICEEVH